LLGKFVPAITSRLIDADFIKALLKHKWPGNIRELLNIIEQTVVMAPGRKLVPELLPEEILNSVQSKAVHSSIKQMEKEMIIELMEVYKGNITQVANEMGIARTTLYRKLYSYGLKL